MDIPFRALIFSEQEKNAKACDEQNPKENDIVYARIGGVCPIDQESQKDAQRGPASLDWRARR
jgi:hypothetical protein